MMHQEMILPPRRREREWIKSNNIIIKFVDYILIIEGKNNSKHLSLFQITKFAARYLDRNVNKKPYYYEITYNPSVKYKNAKNNKKT